MGKYRGTIDKILQRHPELKDLENVSQTRMHYTDAYHHTLDALNYADDLLTGVLELNLDSLRHDYEIAFREFLSDYVGWLEEAWFMRKGIINLEDASIKGFIVEGEPMFFTYLERAGFGKEDAYTPKGVFLVSLLAGHLEDLSMISQDREIIYSKTVDSIKCPHTLELNAAIDPILPDPEFTLTAVAVHDVGKLRKNSESGLLSCHDKAGFALAGKMTRRYFSTAFSKDIEKLVLHHHILPRTKSYRKFAERIFDVTKYGHRIKLLPPFYVMRIADLMAHTNEAIPIMENLFADFMNIPSFALGERLMACPLHVIAKYAGTSVQNVIRFAREKVLYETFRDGIGNDFLFEVFYTKKLMVSR